MNWIEAAESQVPTRLDSCDETVQGMPVTSLKQMKKLIADQSRTFIQNDRAFQKKNRLEKMKNKKRAAKKRKNLEKERKKLKGRKRK